MMEIGEQRPLFLLSLPRAGSTLVQRVLASHEEISTASEPWLLLPQLYALRDRGVFAEYDHHMAVQAITDFIGELPGRSETYLEALRGFVRLLYWEASNGKGRYFLDKSPRYHLIVDDLFRLFPDGKFIFLWRNPLAIVASSNETWARGRWSIHRWQVDLFDGLANLVSAYKEHMREACAVRYEDLVSRPAEAWPAIFEYLDLRFDPDLLGEFTHVELRGRMGDPSGTHRYQAFSTEPLQKWKRSLDNPLRRAWSRRYVRWIGEDRLSIMGYRMQVLLSELDSIPMSLRLLGSDLLRTAYGKVRVAARRVSTR